MADSLNQINEPTTLFAMKKNYSKFVLFVATLAITIATTMLASCHKEPEEPEDNIVTFQKLQCQLTITADDETFTGDFAIMEDWSIIQSDSVLHLLLRCENGNALEIEFHEFEGDSSTQKLNYSQHFYDSNSCYARYIQKLGISDRKSYDLFHGEITFVKLGNSQYRIYGNAFGYETPYITFAMEGGVYDQEYPLGEGTLRIGDQVTHLDRIAYYDMSRHVYDILSITKGSSINIEATNELKHDIPIGNYDSYCRGEAVMVNVAMYHPEDHTYTTFWLESGTLHVTREHDRYILSLDCPSEYGQITATYNGYTLIDWRL